MNITPFVTIISEAQKDCFKPKQLSITLYYFLRNDPHADFFINKENVILCFQGHFLSFPIEHFFSVSSKAFRIKDTTAIANILVQKFLEQLDKITNEAFLFPYNVFYNIYQLDKELIQTVILPAMLKKCAELRYKIYAVQSASHFYEVYIHDIDDKIKFYVNCEAVPELIQIEIENPVTANEFYTANEHFLLSQLEVFFSQEISNN